MANTDSELWMHVAIDNCIQNALDDLKSLKRTYEIWRLIHVWEVMRMSYVCGRKLGKSAECEAALSTLEANIYQDSLQLLFLCLETSITDFDYRSFFLAKADSISLELEELRQILSNESLERISTSHIEIEDLFFMIDLLLDHLSKTMYDLIESIRFLKNLICFVRFRGLEPQQMGDLLIHVRTVLLEICCFFFRYLSEPFYHHPYKIIHRIEPHESQVCEIYVGVLQKALGSPTTIFVNFVDSLLFLLRQLFFLHIHSRVYDDHIYKLYQRLRFLKTTTPTEEHDKINELDRKRNELIGDLICGAGITVCYLIHGQREANLGEKLEDRFLSFEKKFNLLMPEEEVPRYQLPSECPQTNLLGFIDSLLVNINSSSLYEAADYLPESAMNKLNIVHGDLANLRSFLANVLSHKDQNEEVQVLWSRVATVAYETEFVLDSLLAGHTHQSLIVPLDAITSEIDRIKTEVLGISNNMVQLVEFQRTVEIDSKRLLVGKIPKFDEPIVGLDDESKNIIERLTRGTKMLDIVSVFGMAGLGKTTLAKKVYRDPSITFHFHVQGWCTVSQGRETRSLLIEILHSLGQKFVDKTKSEHDLGNELRRYLKGKRYFVILDDIWDIDVWSSLRISFSCDDGTGSRILVTTRSEKVASQIIPNSEPYRLRFLTNDESWNLFRTKCFQTDCPPELIACGESISTCCKGLPLMIIIVAGILSNMEPCKWEDIENSMKKGSLPAMDECEEILELSYRHLPDYLKPCFLYFGAYKEDEQVSVNELLALWIAEGFVMKTEKAHELEDVAEGYMTELVQRNLIMVAERGSRGQVKSCVLHDVLLDFCKRKGKEEHFLHSLHGNELGNCTPPLPKMLYRLHINPANGVENFTESMQVFPHLRTLLFQNHWDFSQTEQWYVILYTFCQSKLLRILVLNSVYAFPFFPNAIPQYLSRLRYLVLDIDPSAEVNIPSSIALLQDLETFIINRPVNICLPDAIWNMRKLRYLKAWRWEFVWELAAENPNCLENLRTLSRVIIHDDQSMKEVIRKFPNVRRLKCILDFNRDQNKGLKNFALGSLSQLESLSIRRLYDDHVCQFQFPQNLKKLTLSNLHLPWSEISVIDTLPNLEVLKLSRDAFTGERWHVRREGTKFPKLRLLRMYNLNLVRWTMDSEDDFPHLEKLVLESCHKLEELPIDFLAQSSTLQLIEVKYCEKTADSIKEIEERKTQFGNEDLKILVTKNKIIS